MNNLENNKPQNKNFAIKIIVRDVNGNICGYKTFQTDSGDSLYDWYNRNSTNELDFPSASQRRKKNLSKKKKGKNNPNSKNKEEKTK